MAVDSVSSRKKIVPPPPPSPKKAPEKTKKKAAAASPKPAQPRDGYDKGKLQGKTPGKVELNPKQAKTAFDTRKKQAETDLKSGKFGKALNTMLNSEGDNVKLKLGAEAKVLIPGTPVKAGGESGTEVKVTRAKDGSYDVTALNEGKLKASLSTEDLRGNGLNATKQTAGGEGNISLGAGISPKYNFKSKEDLDRGLKAIAKWGAGNPQGAALSAGLDGAAKVGSKLSGGLAGIAKGVGLNGLGKKLDKAGAAFKKVDGAVGLDMADQKFLTQHMTGIQVKGGTAGELAGKLNLPKGELEAKYGNQMETSLDITFGKDGKPPKVKVESSGNIDLTAGGRAGELIGPQGEVKGNVKLTASHEFELHGNLDPAKLLKGDITAGVDPKLTSSNTSLELGVGGTLGGHVTPPGGVTDFKANAGLAGKVKITADSKALVKALDAKALEGLAKANPMQLLKNLGNTKLSVEKELSGTGALNGELGFENKAVDVGLNAEAAWTDVLHKDAKPQEITGAQLGQELKGLPSDFGGLLAALGPKEFRAWTRQALVG